MAVPDISVKDYLEICSAAFEWAQSYDMKDWKRCEAILAPSVRLDFRELHGELSESLTPQQITATVGDKKVIGDPLVKTQHLLGANKWESLVGGKVQVSWQARVAHQRYRDEDLKEVSNKGHGYGVVEHIYEKADGHWKIAGIKPSVGWFEYDLFGTLNPPEE